MTTTPSPSEDHTRQIIPAVCITYRDNKCVPACTAISSGGCWISCNITDILNTYNTYNKSSAGANICTTTCHDTNRASSQPFLGTTPERREAYNKIVIPDYTDEPEIRVSISCSKSTCCCLARIWRSSKISENDEEYLSSVQCSRALVDVLHGVS